MPRLDPDTCAETMRLAGFEPLEPYPGSNPPWRCTCIKCGREVSPTYSWVRLGRRCSFCGGWKVDPVDAVAIMHNAGAEPLDPYVNAGAPWRCQCLTCGREIRPRYGSVNRGNAACKYCSSRVVDPTVAVRIMEAACLVPLVPYPGHNKTPWLCRCERCGRTVAPLYNTVHYGGGGCRWCGRYRAGLNAQPGVVYLVTHLQLHSHKIGVCTNNSRLTVHKKYGWLVYNTYHFDVARDALAVEQAIVAWWRKELCHPPYLASHEMPQSGWTETVSADAMSLPDIWSKVCELADRQRTSDLDNVCDDVGLGQLVLF